MRYEVRLTETAKRDIREIASYIVSWSKDRGLAKRTVNSLMEECETLESLPNRGALPKDHMLRAAGYRFLSHGDYLIFYKVGEETQTVFVMAVLNGRRDYMRFLDHLL